MKNVPSYIDDLQDSKTIREYDERYDVTPQLREQALRLPSRVDDAAGALQAVTVGVFSTIIQLLTVLVMAFFLLLDGKKIVGWATRELGPVRGPWIRGMAEDVYRSVGGYVIGAFSISLVSGLATFLMLTILGVEFAVPLAVMMGLFSLIPLVGATLAAILIGIVVTLEDFPTGLIVWVIFSVVYQQVENNLLQPFVYRRTVALHPLLVIVAILAGASVLGVLGALLAITDRGRGADRGEGLVGAAQAATVAAARGRAARRARNGPPRARRLGRRPSGRTTPTARRYKRSRVRFDLLVFAVGARSARWDERSCRTRAARRSRVARPGLGSLRGTRTYCKEGTRPA